MGKVNRKLKAKAKKAIKNFSGLQHQQDDEFSKPNEKESLLHKVKQERKNTSKKEKIRQKHKDLMNKFVKYSKQKREKNKNNKQENSSITGDLKSLKDALPSLNELFELSKDRQKLRTGVQEYDEEPEKLSTKKKLSKKKQEFVSKVKAYETLLKDPDFKKNPRAVISYHIKYTNGLIDK